MKLDLMEKLGLVKEAKKHANQQKFVAWLEKTYGPWNDLNRMEWTEAAARAWYVGGNKVTTRGKTKATQGRSHSASLRPNNEGDLGGY